MSPPCCLVITTRTFWLFLVIALKIRFSLIIPFPVVGTPKYRENLTLPPMPGISGWRVAKSVSPLVISHDFVPGSQNHSSRMGLVQSSSQPSFSKKYFRKTRVRLGLQQSERWIGAEFFLCRQSVRAQKCLVKSSPKALRVMSHVFFEIWLTD